jgi:GH24 family phage-related lysozyme (muramidase)
MATSQEDTRLVLAIAADIASIRRSMQQVGAITKQTTDAVNDNFRRIGPTADQASRQISQSMERAGRQAQQVTRNIGFQLNDIAQGLLAGTSPFTIMAQQTSQITQALDGLDKGTSKVGAIMGAFRSLLNWQTLVTAAAIYGTGALIQYFTESEKAAKKADDVWKRHADAISGLKDAYGDAAKGLDEIGKPSHASRLLDAQRVKDELNDLRKTFRENVIEVSVEVRGQEAIAESLRLQKAIREAFGRGDLERTRELSEQYKKLTTEAGLIEEGYRKVSDRFKDLPDDIQQMIIAIDKGEGSFVELNEALAKFGVNAPPAVRKVVYELQDLIAESVKTERGIQQLGEKFDDLDVILKTFTDTTVPSLLEKLKEWQRATDGILQSYGVDLPGALSRLGDVAAAGWESFTASAEDALSLIERKEDFRPEAYRDFRESTGEFDAWRVGFGSDTYVDEMNQVQRVTKDTVVTLTQARADLNRRVAEFQGMIIRDIGPDMWRSFSTQQQAALTSLTYNFGHFPDSVARAIKQGDKGQVADAIAGLSKPGQVNFNRRREEAAMFAGSDWSPAKDVTEDTREQNAALSDELRIRGEINKGIDEKIAKQQAEIKYGELRREKEKEALEAGRQVTEQELADIRKTADEYGKLQGQKAAADQAKSYEGRLQNLREEAQLLQQQVTQLGASTVAIDQNKVAQEAANEALKIEQALRSQGITVTAGQSQAILQHTTAVATAKAQIEAFERSQKKLTATQQQYNDQIVQTAKTAVSGFVNDLRNGVSAGEAFRNMLDRVIDGMINMAIESMFAKNALGGLFGGGGGLFGGLFGGGGFPGVPGGLYHNGGPVRSTAPMRRVSPSVFAGAPRLHNGLMPDEFPAILQKGEIVIPRTARRGAGSVDNSRTYLGDVRVDVATGMVTANNDDARTLGKRIDQAVQAVLVKESRPGGLLRRVPS